MRQAAPIIVVCDDDRPFVALLCELLADEGYVPIACHTGAAVIEHCRIAPPALIVLDLYLAGALDGLEVVSQLRSAPTTAGVSILVCSAADLYLTRAEAILRSQQCTILRKPFALDDLLALVQHLVTPPPGDPPRSKPDDQPPA